MPKISVDSWTPDAHILLDTSVWIAASSGQRQLLHPGVPAIIEQAAQAERLWVSSFSALEIVNAIRTGHIRIPDFDGWLYDQQRMPGVRVYAVGADVASKSALLPAPAVEDSVVDHSNSMPKRPRPVTPIRDNETWTHNDFIDRVIVATAWKDDLPLFTLDPNIIAYGESGPVRVLDARAV